MPTQPTQIIAYELENPEFQNLKDKLTVKDKEIANLEANIKKINQARQGLQADITLLQNKLLEIPNNSAVSADIKELKEQVKNLDKTITDLQANNKKLVEEKTTLATNLAEQQTKLANYDNLKADLDKLLSVFKDNIGKDKTLDEIIEELNKLLKGKTPASGVSNDSEAELLVKKFIDNSEIIQKWNVSNTYYRTRIIFSEEQILKVIKEKDLECTECFWIRKNKETGLWTILRFFSNPAANIYGFGCWDVDTNNQDKAKKQSEDLIKNNMSFFDYIPKFKFLDVQKYWIRFNDGIINEKNTFVWCMAMSEILSSKWGSGVAGPLDDINDSSKWKRPLAEYEALYDKYLKEISEARGAIIA